MITIAGKIGPYRPYIGHVGPNRAISNIYYIDIPHAHVWKICVKRKETEEHRSLFYLLSNIRFIVDNKHILKLDFLDATLVDMVL